MFFLQGGRNSVRRKTNKKILLAFVAVFAIAMLGGAGIGLWRSVFAMTADQQASYDKLSNERKDLFDKLRVDFVNVKSRVTGTEPFNEGSVSNDKGVDVSASDDYVRTFDVMKYTVELGISPNTAIEGVSDASTFTGGVIKVRAKLPNQGTPTLMTWEKDAWMQNVKYSTDKTEIYAEYHTPANITIVNANQNLSFTVKVGGYKKPVTAEMAPEFEVWMEGNKPDNNTSKVEPQTKKDNRNTIISGHINLNAYISSSDGYLNFKGERDIDGQKTTGQYIGWAYGYYLYQDVSNFSDMRGIEYPYGDIKSKMKLEYLYKKVNEPDAEYVTIKENDTAAIDVINGSKVIAYGLNGIGNSNYYPNSYSSYTRREQPYGRNSGNRGITDSGNFLVEQTGSILSTTQSAYKTDGRTPDFNIWASSSAHTYSDKYHWIASDAMELFAPYYGDLETTAYNYQLKISLTELEYSDINGKKYKTGGDSEYIDANDGDNISTRGMLSYPGGNIDGGIWGNQSYYNAGDENVNYGGDVVVSSDFVLWDGDYLGGAEEINTWNTSFFNIVRYNDSRFVDYYYDNRIGLPTPNINEVEVYYGIYKNDPVNGTNTDEKANAAKKEDFDWYNSVDEAKKHGKISSIDYRSKNQNGWQLNLIKIMRLATVNNPENIGKVGIIRSKKIAYRDKECTQKIYFGGKWRYDGNNGYTPTVYNENGNIIRRHSDTHYGASILVRGFNSSVTTAVLDKDSNGKLKTAYDVQESEIHFSANPRLTNGSNASDADRRVNNTSITTTLPAGLSYKNGSANIAPASVQANTDGTTTITWKIDNWQLNHDLPNGPNITFTAEISASLENNTSLKARSVILNPEDLREASARIGDYGVVISNLAGVKALKSINKTVLEQNENFVVNSEVTNNGQETLHDVRSIEILPKNNDTNGSKFSGSYTLTVSSLAAGQKLYYATGDVNNIGVTKDRYGKNTVKDVDFGSDSRWIEAAQGGTIPANATAIATVTPSIAPTSTIKYSVTVNPNSNKSADTYVFASTASSDNLTQAVKTNAVIATVVTRNLSGRAFVDKNRDGKYTAADDELLKDSAVKLLNASGNVVATTVTDNDGKYIFKEVAKDNYSVQFTLPENYEVIAKSTDNVADANAKSPVYNQLNQPATQAIVNLENVNFGIRIKQGSVITHHYYDGASTKISADINSGAKNYGSSYSTEAAKDIPANYEFKSRSENHSGTVNKPVTEVVYYYQKKNSQLTGKISKTGTEKVLSIP